MNRYGGRTSRTFIVEDFLEDELGQQATDEVTGEQGYVDDERSCFGRGTTTFRSRKLKTKVTAKERAKMDQKEPEELSLVNSKHTNQNCGLKKIVLGGLRENEARKTFRKVMKAFGEVAFALTHQKRVQAMISTRTKAEARIKKKRTKKVLILSQDIQPLKHTVKKEMAIPGYQTVGIPCSLTIPPVQLAEALPHGMTHDILHRWHQSL